jgi:hypothetical protein
VPPAPAVSTTRRNVTDGDAFTSAAMLFTLVGVPAAASNSMSSTSTADVTSFTDRARPEDGATVTLFVAAYVHDVQSKPPCNETPDVEPIVTFSAYVPVQTYT